MYFGKDVDQAIVLFQLETSVEAKHEIFVRDIKPAFDKLINYHYFRMPLIKDEDMKHDCLSFLYEQMGKFDAVRHKRGFPYFNVIVKHFFIQKLKIGKKKVMQAKNFESFSDYSAGGTLDEVLFVDSPQYETLESLEFIKILKENLPKWQDQFSKPQEKQFVDALIHLFDNADNIMHSKKAVYFYLREMTGQNSKQVATNLNKVRRKYAFLKRKYIKGNI